MLKSKLFLICILMLSPKTFAKVPLALKGLDIAVSIEQTGEMFTYNYVVSNPASNSAEIFSIEMSLDYNPITHQALSSAGLSECTNLYKATSESNFSKGNFIPVGSQVPKGWSCGYVTVGENAKPGYRFGSGSIKPGSAANGLILKSRGLPGIRTVYAEPDIDTDNLPEEYEGDPEKTLELEKSISWSGTTIGPTAPPKVFNASSFAKSLDELFLRAVELGWLKDQGVIRSLQAKIDLIEKKISDSNLNAASGAVKALMNELNALKGKKLNSEVYGLLFGNAKYLSEKLSQKPKQSVSR